MVEALASHSGARHSRYFLAIVAHHAFVTLPATGIESFESGPDNFMAEGRSRSGHWLGGTSVRVQR